MPNFKEFLQLNDLEDEFRVLEVSLVLTGLFDDLLEVHVSLSRRVDTGEQIGQQTEEDVVISGYDLWDIEISQGSHQEGSLLDLWLGSFEPSCHD